jgi:hypothetical protein
MTTAPTASRLSAVQGRKMQLDAEVAEWQRRRDDVAARLTAIRGRADGLKVLAAAAALEGTDPKGVRKERAAVLVESEELETALSMADSKLAALTEQDAKAGRAIVVAAALDRQEAVTRLAAALDEHWAPVVPLLEQLHLASEELAAAVRRVFPTVHLEPARGQLLRVLCWRAADLLDLTPQPDARERVPAAEFFSYSIVRRQLEAELAALTPAREEVAR